MAYAVFSVVFGEQPSAAKWNILGTNDASFNDGTGIGNATISPSKLATGAATATVATNQTETNTAYDDMATSGPAVTVTIGANGLALVTVYASVQNDTTNASSHMGFAISGASTVAAADAFSLRLEAYTANNASNVSAVFLVTALTAGSTTFTAKYRVSAGTASYADRKITVIPL